MTYEVPRLIADQKTRAIATRFDPGGNGINVGRTLKRLDVSAYTYCVVAGEIGRLLEHLLADQLDDVDYETVDGETRINGTAIQQSPRAQYEISGIGPAIEPTVLNELLNRFVERAAGGFGVLTGSLQKDIPACLYADLTARIQQGGGRAVVDAHDESLHCAIEAAPFLIKPNRYELETLLGRQLDGLEAVAAEARKLQTRGVEYVCVSMGGDGALLTGPENSYHAASPSVVVRSSVGAGDSMVAAMVAAFARGTTAEEALRLGLACAAGTVSRPGTELFSAADVDNYIERVAVRRLDL